MQRGRFIFTTLFALAAASARVAMAQTPIVSSDFTLQDMKRLPTNWVLNGFAGLEINPTGSGPAVDLAIAHNTGNNTSSAWTNDTFSVPSFTMWADINVDFKPHTTTAAGVSADCPADGFTLAFANTTSPYAIGHGGGSLGLFGNPDDIPAFIGFEINTWYGQSIDDTSGCSTHKNLTFAFEDVGDNSNDRGDQGDVNSGGGKVGQVTAPDALQTGLINGGWYRYQWNADSATGKMGAYLTGLEDKNKAVQNMKLVEVTFASGAPKFNFKGRFGFTAGTGGGTDGVHIAQVVVVSPAVAPGTAPPTTPVAPAAGTTPAPTAGQ
jgi:hypothetical protein